MKGVLRVAAYRRLLTAYTLNELAYGFGTLALSYLVYLRTGSAIGAAVFYVCALFVPALIAPAIVARLDSKPVRSVLPVLYGAEAVLYAILAVLTRHFTLAPVLAITLIDGILAVTARPLARAASVTVTSAVGLLRESNSLTNLAFSGALLVSPLLAGAVVAAGGISLALFIDVGVFSSIALILATCSDLPAAEHRPHEHSRRRLRAALAYTRDNRPARVLLGLQAAGLLFFTISVPIEVVYARHNLHAGAFGYGVLLGAWGGGAVVGGAIYGVWRNAPSRNLIALAAGVACVGFAGLAAAPTLLAAAPFSLLGGIGNGVDGVAVRTAVQEHTDPGWMALVMSFFESINQTMPGLGIVLGGALTALAGARFAWAVAAAGALGVTAATWWLLRAPSGFHEPATDPPL